MKSELLLPVGNMAMCLAAIHHGADAIYVGVPFFNARGRTSDLTIPELKEMIDLCHLYGVKVNLAFNVVIFQDEFPKVIELLKEILPLGPDAFIVQDLGLASLIRQMAPYQRIHASTQMTVTNPDAIKLLDDLKIDRFVLGRENSLSEIKMIRAATDKELEVFVHGALCVAYSGQCFTSESLGGRSANRGQCAQSCRLPYELYVDDVKKELGDKAYLVSPKDLMGLSEVSELKSIGVNSFKIEGRLKTPEYVASTAKNYREVLDGQALKINQRTQELASTYSRGFFSGWLHGVDHQRLVEGTFSSHRGLELGVVKEIRNKKIHLETDTALKPGMGLLFVGKEETGSKIFAVNRVGKHFEIELVNKQFLPTKGQKVFLNSNEVMDKELQKGWQSREHTKRIPLKFLIQGITREPLLVKAIDPEGREVYAQTISTLTPAESRPLTLDQIKEELSALGSTVYEMGTVEAFVDEGQFLFHRELKELRRELVDKMNAERTKVIRPEPVTVSLAEFTSTLAPSKLNLLLRSAAQVEGLDLSLLQTYAEEFGRVILDFEFGKNYESSVKYLKSKGVLVGIATTRILKPQEYYNLKNILRAGPDFILVRNLGALEYLRKESLIPLMGDFSLNVTNSFSQNYLLGKGLTSVNASYDLNQKQLKDLVLYGDPGRLELTLHQYMPEFHMEHCVFAAFLSDGHSFKDCGKPCEKHELKLKDPYGNWHHLKADQECRNTFFKATPQSASFLLNDLRKLGVAQFRLETLNETAEEVNQKLATYLKLIRGELSSREATEELSLRESYGLDQGQFMNTDSYKNRKTEHPTS